MVSGSHAYGLSTPESDIDYRGVYMAPIEAFIGFSKAHRDSGKPYSRNDPDLSLHELGKFFLLASNGNPAALELLFPGDTMVCCSDAFYQVIEERHLFLSEQCRRAYSGYAHAQVSRAEKILSGEKTDSGRWKERTLQKHLRHTFRLLYQGVELLTTGELTLELTGANLANVWEWSHLPLEEAIEKFKAFDVHLSEVKSALPMGPDIDGIDQLLIEMRRSE